MWEEISESYNKFNIGSNQCYSGGERVRLEVSGGPYSSELRQYSLWKIGESTDVVCKSPEFDPCNSTTHKHVPSATSFVGDIGASQIPVTKRLCDPWLWPTGQAVRSNSDNMRSHTEHK